MARATTVGIWGYYFARNFGDDLMALLLANFVKTHNAIPLVFDLEPAMGAKWDINVTDDVEVLVSSSDLIVIGGGNLLAWEENWYKGPFMDKLSRLVFECEKQKKPIHALSIGGDGPGGSGKLPGEVKRLLKSKFLKSCLVRLPSDLETLSPFEATSTYVPDILWCAADYFGVSRAPISGERTLGLHLPNDSVTSRAIRASDLFRGASSWRRIFIDTCSSPNTSLDFVPGSDSDCDRLGKADNPVDLIRVISECDVVVSHKLHVGLVALSMGIPFIAFRSHPKVKAQLAQLGWTRISATWQSSRTRLDRLRLTIQTILLIEDSKKVNYLTKLKSELPIDLIARLRRETLEYYKNYIGTLVNRG